MSTPEPPKNAADAGEMTVSGDGASVVPSGQMGGKRSAWMTHVKKTMRANKGMKLKQVLKVAKKSYKKTMRGGSKGGVAAGAAEVGMSGGRRHKKGSRKNGSRKH